MRKIHKLWLINLLQAKRTKEIITKICSCLENGIENKLQVSEFSVKHSFYVHGLCEVYAY